MGRVTDLAPAGLVPAAWLLTIAAHADVTSEHALLVGMVVMDVVLIVFYIVSRGEMTGPVLPAWRQVLLAGLLATLLGTVDLVVAPESNPALPVTLYAWMLLPGVAYARTGGETEASPHRRTYFAVAAGSILGAALYSLPFVDLGGGSALLLAGLAVIGIAQTAGIVSAALQNTGGSSTSL